MLMASGVVRGQFPLEGGEGAKRRGGSMKGGCQETNTSPQAGADVLAWQPAPLSVAMIRYPADRFCPRSSLRRVVLRN
jgi:hypothetical protein